MFNVKVDSISREKYQKTDRISGFISRIECPTSSNTNVMEIDDSKETKIGEEETFTMDFEDLSSYFIESESDTDSETEDSTSYAGDTREKSSGQSARQKKKQNLYSDQARIMFEKSNLSVNDVVCHCSVFSLKYSLTKEARSSLINLVKTCAGPEFNDLKISQHRMDRVLDSPEVITRNFFCSKCFNILYSGNVYVDEASILCDKCATVNVIYALAPNSFYSIDLEYQMNLLLRNKEMKHDISEKL